MHSNALRKIPLASRESMPQRFSMYERDCEEHPHSKYAHEPYYRGHHGDDCDMRCCAAASSCCRPGRWGCAILTWLMVIAALTLSILALIQANNHSDDSDMHSSFASYKLTADQCISLPAFGEDVISVDASACNGAITGLIQVTAGANAMCVKLAGNALAYYCN